MWPCQVGHVLLTTLLTCWTEKCTFFLCLLTICADYQIKTVDMTLVNMCVVLSAYYCGTLGEWVDSKWVFKLKGFSSYNSCLEQKCSFVLILLFKDIYCASPHDKLIPEAEIRRVTACGMGKMHKVMNIIVSYTCILSLPCNIGRMCVGDGVPNCVFTIGLSLAGRERLIDWVVMTGRQLEMLKLLTEHVLCKNSICLDGVWSVLLNERRALLKPRYTLNEGRGRTIIF